MEKHNPNSTAYRHFPFILIGAGGRGRMWATSILEPLLSRPQRIKPVAIVDPNPDIFPDACAGLGLGWTPNGFQGGVFDGRHVYFVPIRNGTGYHGEILRYDAKSPPATPSTVYGGSFY